MCRRAVRFRATSNPVSPLPKRARGVVDKGIRNAPLGVLARDGIPPGGPNDSAVDDALAARNNLRRGLVNSVRARRLKRQSRVARGSRPGYRA